MTVPHREDLDALTVRLNARSIPFSSDGRSVTAADPWGTRITVALPDVTTEEMLNR